MKTIKRIIVSAILISIDGKILLGKVEEGGVYPGCWHIPGGGVDEGETKLKALVREVKEEVGIEVSGCKTELISDSDTDTALKTDKVTGEKFEVEMHFNVYSVQLDQNAHEIQVSLDDDLVEYKWVKKAELSNYKHTPPSEKLFKSLGWI